jgi:hypothetical protein
MNHEAFIIEVICSGTSSGEKWPDPIVWAVASCGHKTMGPSAADR